MVSISFFRPIRRCVAEGDKSVKAHLFRIYDIAFNHIYVKLQSYIRFEVRNMRDYQRGLSQEHLKTDVLYDPATGEFIRRKTGNVAGCTRRDGKGKYYRELRVAGDTYYAHRLAWFYVHGVWPRYMIDHINGDGTDNRISNLRDCTNSQNTFHSSKSNRSGLRGVSYVPEMKRYRAHIRKDMKLKHLGYFYTEQEAFAAYVKAGRSLFGDFIHADILAVIRTFNPSEGAK